ncbi:hypothetical protein OOK31_01120 [Streptomyces sp. NBC_00249]|uniref:hypothetical protein n=1 Tax=Streptomyces sp. NBC_00249 TaxID=2975690 RepID=UPI002258A9B3|nr:hypothetical protein [Streptomyces sp. NBC_00249]MCX5192502.1 hypothetical protein [Streptomyces sp. NBC_00249]
MRPSSRVRGVLAGLVLGLVAVAVPPAAHADIQACENHVQDAGVPVTDAVRTACSVAFVGDLPGCVSTLTGAGMTDAAATGACRQAPR